MKGSAVEVVERSWMHHQLVIRKARLEDQGDLVDIAITDGFVTEIGHVVTGDTEHEVEAAGRLVAPAFVQPHLHLDKVNSAPSIGLNVSGTLGEAIELLHQSKRVATVGEVAHRAGVVIRQAVLAGTTFIRSHVDVDTIGGLVPLLGVLQAARDHEDICDVEIVAFPQEGLLRDPGADELMAEAMSSGASVVGGMPHWEAGPVESAEHIVRCLTLARACNADVDMHVDETDDPTSRTLESLLEATESFSWQGRVTASHCCAMAAWEQPYRHQVIGRMASLGVSLITNPATNLLLQGRLDEEPRRRGIPPVKELVRAGVRVGCGQDCVEDAFYPFGAADPLQVALILCHAAQLSTPAEIRSGLGMVREEAASILGLESYGIAVGSRANLVVFDATDSLEALRLQSPRSLVIHEGRVVAETTRDQTLYRAPAESKSLLAAE
jgi:cytosine deaminase